MRILIGLCTIVVLALTSACTSAAAGLAPDASVDQVLDALDARGQGLTSFTADVQLCDADAATGDATMRLGKVMYQTTDANARIRVVFDKKQVGSRITDDKVEYLLDGTKLIDRSYRAKTQTTRQVLKPGEKMNLLKLGEGPFPLPIGQRKEDVHAMFEVKKIELKNDPKDTVHLQFAPKPGSRFERRFKTIDVWAELKDGMPRRIETVDRNETTVRTTDLSNVQINPKLSDSDFTLPRINASEWQMIDEAFAE